MMSRRTVRILVLASLSLAMMIPLTHAQYIMLAAHIENSTVRIYNLDREGKLSVRSSLDLKGIAPKYYDSEFASFSPKGNYAVVHEWSYINQVLFSVESDYSLQAMALMTGGGWGDAGFSPDDKLLFVSEWSGEPSEQVYRLAGGSCSLVGSFPVPTTATQIAAPVVTSRDEVISSGVNEDAPDALVIYQYDRLTTSLAVKQYTPEVRPLCSAMTRDENLVVAGGSNKIITLARQPDNTFAQTSTIITDNPVTPATVYALAITPDDKYVVAACYGADIGGFYLCRITPDKKLKLLSQNFRIQTHAVAISPDGKYVVGGYEQWHGSRIGVFRINESLGVLDEITTMSTPWTASLSFHPTALPPAKANANWCLYQ